MCAKNPPIGAFFLLSTHSQSSRCGIFLRTDTCLTLLITRMGKCPQLTTLQRWLRISDCLHGSISIEAKPRPRSLTNMVSSFYFLNLLQKNPPHISFWEDLRLKNHLYQVNGKTQEESLSLRSRWKIPLLLLLTARGSVCFWNLSSPCYSGYLKREKRLRNSSGTLG